MPTLSDIFNLDPNVERLTLLPRLRGSLPSEKSVMMPDRYMFDVIAPKFLYDFIRAVKSPGRAAKGEALDEEEALNTAMNMFGGGLATSGSVPLGALGMSARTAPAGSIPLREVPRSPLGFYSKVEEATLPLQNKGSGSQFLAQIQKTPGVKPEEIEVLGLDKFLQSKPTVTKQEIQDYITANKPDVQETVLGGPEAFNQKRLTQLEDEFAKLKQHPIDDPNFGEEKYNEMIRLMNIRDQSTTSDLYRQADDAMKLAQRAQARGYQDTANNYFRQYELLNTRAEKLDLQDMGMANPPKFSQYTIPGGENYRELLLTLPRKTVQAEPLDVSGFSVRTTEDAMRPYTGQRDIEVLDSAGNVVSRRSGFRGTDEEAIQNYAGTVTTQAQKADESLLNYRSSHFDQPNILTHLRANDRVIDGKKALFIEEIQSDWHQAGRKKGYGTTYKPEDITPIPVEKAKSQYGVDNADLFWYFNAPDNVYQIPKSRFAEQSEALNYVLNEKQKMGVPDAPFKKSWHELALKRAIQEAVDKGYDKLAFTTGKTQAERYDLSKQIKTIVYGEPDEAGRRTVRAITPNGDQLLGGKYTMSEIEDNIGKEMAEKIQKSTGEFDQRTGTYAMSGLDLQVGGEGMKGFYDEILPKALQNLTKKYGTKVTKTTMKAGQDVTEPGIVAPGVGMEFAGKTTKAPEVEVWSMDITPQMREQVKAKGQPLFATAPPLGLATQDPLEQFVGAEQPKFTEQDFDPLMRYLGYK